MSAELTSNPSYKLHKKLMRRRAIRESWPLLVWLGVAVLAVWAYQTGADFERMRGVVSKPVETVSAPIEGRLIPLPTDNPDINIPRDENGQPKTLEQGVYVNAGDVVAKIDDTMLRTEIEAERETIVFDRAKLQQELQQHVYDFQERVFQLKNQKQLLEEQIGAQEQVYQSTKREVERQVALPSALAAVQTQIDELRAELASVERSIVETEKLVNASLENIENLRSVAGIARLPQASSPPEAENRQGDGETPGAVDEARQRVDAIAEESATVRLLRQKVEESIIRATNAGFIDKVYAQPGSVMKVGDPIMDIVIQAPKTIAALIPEVNALTLEEGDTVYIAIPNNRKEFVTATVLSLQQSLTQLPDHASPIRGRMIRGRMVEFGNLENNDGDSQLPLLPGSEVIISLERPGRLPFLSWFTE